MSFASLASGSNDVVATSIPASSAELIISAIRTNEIARSSAISSILPTPTATAAISTAKAIAKWMRMFRCVRRTWITPSNAKLKLSSSDGPRRVGAAITRAPPRGAPSRRRGRSRAGGAGRGRAAPATCRRRPEGTALCPRAGAERRWAARLARRSGTRGRPSPRPGRGIRPSTCASRQDRRSAARGRPRRCPRPRARGARALRRPVGRPRSRFGSRSQPSATTSLPTLRAGLLRVLAVRLHDALDELVTHDVLVPEADERDSFERPEDVLHLDQTRRLLAWQVDLGHVPGDDDLRAEAEPCQEHLHLLGARVLRLVEDDERVVQRAAAHERQRGDLDDALLHVGGEP